MYAIRLAVGDDALGVQAIYAPFVSLTTISFETSVPRVYEMKRRINAVTSKYPWLICEVDGVIAGYAYAQPLFERVAYSRTAELAVYVHENYRRCNIASALYYALIELLKAQGFCTATARISAKNEESIHFHASFGFSECGRLHNVGYKMNEWLDIVLMEKQLSEYMNPREVVPITSIDEDARDAVFRKAEKIVRIRL